MTDLDRCDAEGRADTAKELRQMQEGRMKSVLIKALIKAKQKNLSIEDTADLVTDYLDIACDISPVEERATPEPPPVVIAPVKQAKIVDIGRSVSPKRSSAWKTDELYSLLSKHDMSFTTRPEGWSEDLEFRFSLVKDPSGMKGVGVVWQAVKDPQFKQNYFFSLDIDQPNVELVIDEVRKSVDSTLRRRDKPVSNSTVPLRSVPSDIASMAGFSASV